MKKVLLFSLILALVGMTILPAVAVPKSAEAGLFDATITCDPVELNFIHYTGVPETLLGFIPLASQAVTVTANKCWFFEDDADWLSVGYGSIFGGLGEEAKVWLNNNVDDLEAGTYTATITVTASGLFASASATIDVTLEVIEPKVMGPLGIGMLNIFDTSTENYGGFVLNLLTNPDDAMDMQAIETDGCFNLMLQRGEEIPGAGFPLTGGAFTLNGETKQIVGGGGGEFSVLTSMMPPGMLPIPPDFDWGDNRVVMFFTEDGVLYVGLILADLAKMLDLLPMLGDMFSGQEAQVTSLPAFPTGKNPKSGAPTGAVVNEPSPELVIPLKPILNLLPALMPVMMNLLGNETVLAILEPLMGLLPPIIIVMPFDVMMDLFSGLM
jgi:hypothetical protein